MNYLIVMKLNRQAKVKKLDEDSFPRIQTRQRILILIVVHLKILIRLC